MIKRRKQLKSYGLRIKWPYLPGAKIISALDVTHMVRANCYKIFILTSILENKNE